MHFSIIGEKWHIKIRNGEPYDHLHSKGKFGLIGVGIMSM